MHTLALPPPYPTSREIKIGPHGPHVRFVCTRITEAGHPISYGFYSIQEQPDEEPRYTVMLYPDGTTEVAGPNGRVLGPEAQRALLYCESFNIQTGVSLPVFGVITAIFVSSWDIDGKPLALTVVTPQSWWFVLCQNGLRFLEHGSEGGAGCPPAVARAADQWYRYNHERLLSGDPDEVVKITRRRYNDRGQTTEFELHTHTTWFLVCADGRHLTALHHGETAGELPAPLARVAQHWLAEDNEPVLVLSAQTPF